MTVWCLLTTWPDAIQAFGDSAVQAMVALMQARPDRSLVQDGIRTIEMAGLTADQRRLPTQRNRTRSRRYRHGDRPEKRFATWSNRIISDSTDIQLALTPDNRRQTVLTLSTASTVCAMETQARIDKLNTLIADNASTTMAKSEPTWLETIAADGQPTADKQSASVDTFASAVTDFADAAAEWRPRRNQP